jgi:hypothetical protein
MAITAIVLNVLSAITALVAAVCWYFSARTKLPEMKAYWDGVPSDDPFFVAVQKSVILNRWAAGFAAASAVCTALAIFVSLGASH